MSKIAEKHSIILSIFLVIYSFVFFSPSCISFADTSSDRQINSNDAGNDAAKASAAQQAAAAAERAIAAGLESQAKQQDGKCAS